jgi:hypothetical protein
MVHIVNLDPAAESFAYKPALDVRELVTVPDVMEEMELGPNGALVYSMEYLLENLNWLEVGHTPICTDCITYRYHSEHMREAGAVLLNIVVRADRMSLPTSVRRTI